MAVQLEIRHARFQKLGDGVPLGPYQAPLNLLLVKDEN